MHEKQIEMIKVLKKSKKPLTGKQLASMLGITNRTVITYINEINSYFKEPSIISTHRGYILFDSQIERFLKSDISDIPQTYQERTFYIIKKLLLNHIKSIDAYTLCDELYISYSLLKNDIKKMNQSFAYLNIRFIIKNNSVSILGDEKDKRKLMTHIIKCSQDTDFIDINRLKQYFLGDSVEVVLQIINDIHENNHYYLNDFSRINLLVHILIMINRINGGNKIKNALWQDSLDTVYSDDNYYELTKEIKERLEYTFSLEIGPEEQIQLYFLIKSTSTWGDFNSTKDIKTYVSPELFNLVKRLIEAVEKKYFIQLSSEIFQTMFALHIKNFLLRMQMNSIFTNPLKKELSYSSPFLYDIAIFILECIAKEYNISTPISEDEISYIVLHIAAEIERQNSNDKIIKCVLLSPQYLDMNQILAQRLLFYLGNQITIVKCTAFVTSLENCEFDMLISTIQINEHINKKIVKISPFITEKDVSTINDAISEVHKLKLLSYLSTNFDFYFSEKNFTVNDKKITNRDQAIDYLCDLLYVNGYVERNFKEHVWGREQAISTAFSNFAIPHSVCLDAMSNGIAVLISETGIQWDDHIVHIVLLMAISPDTLQDFQHLYNTIAMLLTETDIVEYLKKCTTINEFKHILLNPYFIQ